MSWLRRWVTEYLDLLIALVLTAVGQAEVWFGLVQGGPRLPVALLVGIGTLAVALRRIHPITAVLVTCGSMTAQTALGVDSNTAFAPLMAPPIAVSPTPLLTGRDSPVSMASLNPEEPSRMRPSTGTLAPGRTITRSPLSLADLGALLASTSGALAAGFGQPVPWEMSRQIPVTAASTGATHITPPADAP